MLQFVQKKKPSKSVTLKAFNFSVKKDVSYFYSYHINYVEFRRSYQLLLF